MVVVVRTIRVHFQSLCIQEKKKEELDFKLTSYVFGSLLLPLQLFFLHAAKPTDQRMLQFVVRRSSTEKVCYIFVPVSNCTYWITGLQLWGVSHTPKLDFSNPLFLSIIVSRQVFGQSTLVLFLTPLKKLLDLQGCCL